MKIIHTADWHIGQTFFGYERIEEHQFFLDWLTAQITALEADILLVCGDIFDVANPSAQAQRQFYRFLKQATTRNPGLQIIIIAGNHDSATRLETPVPLLEEMNIYIRGVVPRKNTGEIDMERLIIELKDRNGKREGWCMAVPYLRQGDYPPGDAEENPYGKGVKRMYDALLAAIEQRRQADEAIVAMGHLQTCGCWLSENDPSERLIIGGLEGLPEDTFSPEITYTALGHIHREQWVNKQKAIRYAGSPLPMSCAEENYRHGVIFLEISAGKIIRQKKIPFCPPTPLLRIPRHPEPLSDVLLYLAQLPEETEHEAAPYLEVCVLLTGPEPALRNRIEEAVQHKNVRLTRVVPFYPETTSAESSAGFISAEELMDPWKMLQTVYEKKYRQTVPDYLARLFRTALEESYSKLEDTHENTTH